VQSGVLSLALRSLGDSNGVPLTAMVEKKQPVPTTGPRVSVSTAPINRAPAIFVYRYGVLQPAGGQIGSGPAGGGGVVQTAAAGELP
jgi:hypothetical protein